ncbi:hypothetical protein IAD21_00478 [Abditibacteriota bacterium]|nr:hypothetical protein IAD21_00478 [Abditibacteriota bacterium]
MPKIFASISVVPHAIPRSVSWLLTALIASVWGYMALADHLDRSYRPFSTDIPTWILCVFPTAVLLAVTSAYALASHLGKSYLTPGWICISVAGLLIVGYLALFLHTLSLHSFKYALSESGPAFVWSAFLLVYGIFLVVSGSFSRRV